MALLRHDVLGREGNDLRASWAYDNRCDGRVIRPRVPVRELTRETVVALESLGGTVVRAIQCHQELTPKDPETLSKVVLCKAHKDLKKDGVEMARGDGIEEAAEVIVAGNLRDAKQGMGVMAGLVCLEPALVLYKRGRLGQEEAKGASSRSGHTVLGMAACTTVGQLLDPLLEHGLEIIAV